MPASPKHPRLRTAVRKAVKWGGLAVSLPPLTAWLSQWSSPVFNPLLGFFADVERGGLFLYYSHSRDSEAHPVTVRLLAPDSRYTWQCTRTEDGDYGLIGIPLWFPAAVALLAASMAWRADVLARRRARQGLCPACGYDRAGLAPGAVCPECEKQPDAR